MASSAEVDRRLGHHSWVLCRLRVLSGEKLFDVVRRMNGTAGSVRRLGLERTQDPPAFRGLMVWPEFYVLLMMRVGQTVCLMHTKR